jgi:hypothetical protein
MYGEIENSVVKYRRVEFENILKYSEFCIIFYILKPEKTPLIGFILLHHNHFLCVRKTAGDQPVKIDSGRESAGIEHREMQTC